MVKDDDNADRGLMRVVDDLHEVTDRTASEQLTIGDLLDKVGERSHGALILVPALLAFLPTGGIPTVPTIMAAMIVIIAAQMVFSPDHIWLPRRLRGFTVGNSRLRGGLRWFRPWAQKFSWLFRNRLTFINERPFSYLVVLALIAMAATMPLLEFLPFAAAAPSFVMVVIGLGLTMDDGLWTLAGLSLAVAALALFFYLLFIVIL